jgi:type VI secretion system protein VasD
MISADAELNRDRQQRPTPVQVRLYELKSPATFNSGDFFTLYEKDDQFLGTELAFKEQITLQPGQTVTLVRKVKPEAQLLGVFVAFRDVDKSVWRATTPLPQPKELGRFALLSPSFEAAVVNIKIGPNMVSASTTAGDVPVIPASLGAARIPSVSLPGGISLPGGK